MNYEFKRIIYSLKAILQLIIFCLLVFEVKSQNPVTDCSNIGFQTGTSSGWLLQYGKVRDRNSSLVFDTPINGTLNFGHRIMTLGDGNDPNINLEQLPCVPPGSTYSMRIGNDRTRSYYDRATTSMLITPSNNLFQYQFAIVFQDPSHFSFQQPKFSLTIKDGSGNIIPCGFYEVASAANITGFLSQRDLRYRRWTTVSVDLTNYIGQYITISVTTNDCTEGGHYGYAYFTAKCLKTEITTSTYCPGIDNSITLVAPQGFQNYLWSTGQNTSTLSIQNPVAGTKYKVILTPFSSLQENCDLTVSYTIPDKTVVTQDTIICIGESLRVGNSIYTQPGQYTDLVNHDTGCDTITITNLKVLLKYRDSTNMKICEGTSVTIGQQTFDSTGVYYIHIPTKTACDSLFILNLTKSTSSSTRLNSTICQGRTYPFFGTNLSIAGQYIQLIPTSSECDSTIRLNLSVTPPPFSQSEITMCQGDSLVIGGKVINSSGLYNILVPTNEGCDSIVKAQVDIYPIFADSDPINTTICAGDSLIVAANKLKLPGIYDFKLKNTYGCDSIFSIKLSNYPKHFYSNEYNLCQGENIFLHDRIFTQSTIFQKTFKDVNNCDSTFLETINFYPNNYKVLNIESCKNKPIHFWGKTYGETGVYSDTIQSLAPTCDSIAVLNVTIHELPSDSVTHVLCQGTELHIGNIIYNQPGIYQDTIPNISGCDSVHLREIKYVYLSLYLDNIKEIYKGDSIQLIPIFSGPSTLNWLWSPSTQLDCPYCPDPIAKPFNSTVYTVQMIDSVSGCFETSQIEVIVKKFPIYIPNAISRNGDGVNDAFYIYPAIFNIEIEDALIFDRWGNILSHKSHFSSLEPIWDGKFNGSALNPGVFVYLIKIKYFDNSYDTLSGTITIVE